MDSIGEENGNSSNVDEGHNLSTTTPQQAHQSNSANSGVGGVAGAVSVAPPASVLTTTANVVQYLPAPPHNLQANQSSVIQVMQKGDLVFGTKPSTTVIHTTSGRAVQIKPEPNTQHPDTNSDDSLSDEDSPRRKEFTRRPSYHKIFNEISGPDITGGTTLQMSETGGLPTISSTGGSTGSTLIQLPQEGAPTFYLPHRIPYSTNNSVIAEDQTRKREIRLQKNREAARECRRKKKEYIKCLENRVAVLENQNKALIEELKSLKELYCQTKND